MRRRLFALIRLYWPMLICGGLAAGCRAPHPPAPPAPVARVLTVRVVDQARYDQCVADQGAPLDCSVLSPLAGAHAYSEGVYDGTTDYAGRFFATVMTPSRFGACAELDHYLTRCEDTSLTPDGPADVTLPLTHKFEPPVYNPRTGVVHQWDRSYADAGGKFLSLGTSLFWELWGTQHDLDRLKTHNLKPIADSGQQDVRVMLVLPTDGLWAIRRVDPFAANFASIVAQAVDLNYNDFGLRTGITIFGGRVGTDDQHAQIVQTVCGALQGRESRITHVEIANEGGNNGFTRQELWRHAAAVRACLPTTLVELTSTENYPGTPDEIYTGSPANAFAFHPDRDTGGDGGVFRPSRQPYGYRTSYPLPTIGENGEPRGIQSSISASDDPTVLAADAAMTWLSGWGRYVFHVGAGVFGAGPEEVAATMCGSNACDNKGRPADWDASPNVTAVAHALATLRAGLPQDLADYGYLTHADPSKQEHWPFVTEPSKQWDAAYRAHGTRAYVAYSGAHFFLVVLGQAAPIDIVAKQSVAFKVRSLTTYEVLASVDLPGPGAAYSLPVFSAAVLIEGDLR